MSADQPDKSQSTNDLQEFTVSIEWTINQEPLMKRVIARSLDDAQTIAVRLFRESHTEKCLIDNVRVVSHD